MRSLALKEIRKHNVGGLCERNIYGKILAEGKVKSLKFYGKILAEGEVKSLKFKKKFANVFQELHRQLEGAKTSLSVYDFKTGRS